MTDTIGNGESICKRHHHKRHFPHSRAITSTLLLRLNWQRKKKPICSWCVCCCAFVEVATWRTVCLTLFLLSAHLVFCVRHEPNTLTCRCDLNELNEAHRQLMARPAHMGIQFFFGVFFSFLLFGYYGWYGVAKFIGSRSDMGGLSSCLWLYIM